MVSTRLLISLFFSLFTNTIGVTVTFMFHIFFSSRARSESLSLFSLSFSFTLWSARMAKYTTQKVLFSFFFLFLTIARSGCLAEIRWFVCVSKSLRSFCASFSWTDPGLCIYYLFVWSNLNFLHNSQWITFPTQSCLVLYSFCVNLLHSLIMWLIISSLSPHNLHRLFCCILSIYHSSSSSSSYYYYYYYYYYYSLRVFHISFSWWSFTGVWVTTSLLKSPGLFSVFWPFSVML